MSRCEILSGLYMSKKKVLVFGCGYVYNLIRKQIADNFELAGFVDNNSNLWDTTLDNVKVYNPAEISRVEFDFVVLASSNVSEMAKQLSSLGINRDKLIVGWNYAFSGGVDNENSKYEFGFSDNFSIISSYSNKDEKILRVNMFRNKTVLFSEHNIPTILALFLGDRLTPFFKLAAKYVNKKGIFLDIGSNIGTTLLEAVENESVERCIGFEPSSANYSLLMANVGINNLHKKVSVHNVGVGEKSDNLSLYLSPSCSGDNRIRSGNPEGFGLTYPGRTYTLGGRMKSLERHSNMLEHNQPADNAVESVPVVSLDEFIDDETREKIAFMWVDVQGYEYYVLKGGERLIDQCCPAIQIEYWPLGLNETGTLGKLNELIISKFRYIIDMDSLQAGKDPVLQDAKNIREMEGKLAARSQTAAAHPDASIGACKAPPLV
jgi:FkbM family methyltransferase